MRASFLSICYRTIRYLTTNLIYFFQILFLKPIDLEPAVKLGDTVLSSFGILGKLIYDFPIPVGKNIEIYELTFPSPLIGASFKSEPEILDIWLRMGLGGVVFKTVMKEKRIGNARPRLQDARIHGEKGLLNSLGLPGPGIANFINDIVHSMLWEYGRPLGISIGGDTVNEYVKNIDQVQTVLQHHTLPYFYEVNISCPNTENGQTICEDPATLNSLLSAIKKTVSNPISVKVSPDVSNETLGAIGEICTTYDTLLINAGNTQYKTPNEVGVKQINFAMDGGGLSGPAIFKRTLEMVSLFAQFNIPIIATGGISTFNHVQALKAAGASLFGMATALVLDPYCIPRIHSRL